MSMALRVRFWTYEGVSLAHEEETNGEESAETLAQEGALATGFMKNTKCPPEGSDHYFGTPKKDTGRLFSMMTDLGLENYNHCL